MTWLLLAIAAVIVWALFRDDRRCAHAARTRPTVEPRIDGLVHFNGFNGRSILLESPRGVELPIDGDAWRTDTDAWVLDDVLEYLAEVDRL